MMAPDRRNPQWTAYPDPAPTDKPVSSGRRVRSVRLLGIPAVLGALVLGVSAGSAYAYFKSTGSGNGSASVRSAVNVTVTTATATASLLPGGKGDVYFTLTNNNPFAVTFSSVTAGAAVASNNITACPNSNISLAQTLPYPLSPTITVNANSTNVAESIANLVQLSSSAPSTCQGVTFTVTLSLSGQQP